MKLGYDLTIEQTQKLTMTPEHCATLRPRKYPRKEEKPQQAFC